MPTRAIQFYPGDCYHLYNRGNNRENIVVERENYVFFLRRAREYLLSVMDILAYCLMPNHYHLLVKIKTSEVFKTSEVEVSEVSRAMMRLAVSYTKALNKRYGRVGSLFQGRFQVKGISPDRLLDLTCYIHHNPVAAGIVASPEAWPFSSCREYFGERRGTLPTPGPVLAQLPAGTSYRAYLADYQTSEVFETSEV